MENIALSLEYYGDLAWTNHSCYSAFGYGVDGMMSALIYALLFGKSTHVYMISFERFSSF